MSGSTPLIESPRRDRRDFIRAVHEHLWRAPGTDRPTVRPQTVVTVAALTAIAALVTGVVLHLVRPRSDDATVAAPPAVTGPATYNAVSGWDCATAGDHGFEIGGRTAAWYTVASGGWVSDGCHGSFESMPMLAAGQSVDGSQYALWWFQPTGVFDRCDLSVYIPLGRAQDAGTSAVRYAVLSAKNGTPIGQVTINQATARGSWVAVGSYPSGVSGLGIRLDDPVGDGRLAIAQARLHCGR